MGELISMSDWLARRRERDEVAAVYASLSERERAMLPLARSIVRACINADEDADRAG